MAKRTQLTLIYLISLYTRQNQGRVSCSLYSGNIVVYISHIVEPYNATCVYDYHSCWSVGIHYFCLLSIFAKQCFLVDLFPLGFLEFVSCFPLVFVTCHNVFWYDLERFVYNNVQNTKNVCFLSFLLILLSDAWYEVFFCKASFLITIAPNFFCSGCVLIFKLFFLTLQGWTCQMTLYMIR